MSYLKLQFNQPQYIQFDQNCPKDIIDFICQKMNSKLIEEDIQNPTVIVSFKYIETDVWITPQNAFSISFTNFKFKIQYSFYPQLLPKLIFDCIAASLILRKNYLLIHGMLLDTGEILYGQPYSGKTTLAKQLNNVLCDDQVLVDLDNNIAYPVPYFYFDSSSLFNDLVKIKPVSLKSIKPINKQQDLLRCLIMFLYQPYAQRYEVFTCEDFKKWSNFQIGFQCLIITRIKQILAKIQINNSNQILLQR